jgi:osmotically-inducible protein OsmY
MKRNIKYGALAAVLAVLGPLTAFATVTGQAGDGQVQAEVQKKLDGSKYKGVTVQVQNGVVKLSGTVELFSYKDQAQDRVRRVKGVTAIDNEIQIAGKEVPDAQLQKEIGKKIYYDRIGWWDCPFNYITAGVSDGVVTLQGHAAVPWAAGDAVSIAANTPGVKDVIDEIQIDQVSQFDNQSRMALYAAIYGQPTLNMYAADPARPIRITVNNGQVTLNGVVDDNMAKEIAGIQANQVPNIFKVTNDLVVQGDTKKQK